MTERVLIHIGAYKTGTTYVQQRLWANREALAARGVLFPAWRGWGDQVRGFKHVLARDSLRGGPVPAQQWERLATAVRDWDGPTAVLSYEGLSVANSQQVKRLVEDLAPAEVQVILTARDLVRVIPAMWQEQLQGGQSWSWPQYVSTVTGALGRTVPPGRVFWQLQDLRRVLAPWAEVVGSDRVHVVTVPPEGGAPELLWDRFCAALGLDPTAAPAEPADINESLDPASAELMRRINIAVEGRLDADVYDRVLKGLVAKRVLAEHASADRVRLSVEQADWARTRGRVIAGELADAGFRVHGDLDDLVGEARPAASAAATTEQTLDAAVLVIEALVRKVGATTGRSRAKGGRRGREDAADEDADDLEPAEAPKVGSRPASRLMRQAYEKLRR